MSSPAPHPPASTTRDVPEGSNTPRPHPAGDTPTRFCVRSTVPVVILVLAVGAGTGARAQSDLGTIEFPTSGAPEAQIHFLRGLAALHSFWRSEAVRSFREAQRLDADFAMAYWGEALAYDGVWGTGHDAEAARDALNRLAPTAAGRRARAPTERERAYLAAIEILYGEGERFERARRYVEAMAGIVDGFPEDLEAKALLARAVLATVDAWNFKDEVARAQAGAIAEEVFRSNPDHPGATHYIIHAYDSPERAERALPAARVYAKVAPASSHAVHMPSHIYFQLGMWEDAITSNRRAFQVSNEWVRETGRPITDRDYHPLDFLFYAYLQLGRYREARATLDSLRRPFQGKSQWSWAEGRYHSRLALYALETGRCDELPSPAPEEGESPAVFFVLGWCAVEEGRIDSAEKWLGRIETGLKRANAGTTGGLRQEITHRELAAWIAAARDEAGRAERLAEEAVLLRRKLGPQGELPNPILPVHELYADVLLKLDRPTRAAGQLDFALSINPNRASALLKRARAAARMGDDSRARSVARQLLDQWSKADPDSEALREARSYAQRGH